MRLRRDPRGPKLPRPLVRLAAVPRHRTRPPACRSSGKLRARGHLSYHGLAHHQPARRKPPLVLPAPRLLADRHRSFTLRRHAKRTVPLHPDGQVPPIKSFPSFQNSLSSGRIRPSFPGGRMNRSVFIALFVFAGLTLAPVHTRVVADEQSLLGYSAES